MLLETKRLVLREVKRSDRNSLVEDMNNIQISSCLLGVPHPFTRKDAKQWIKHCKKSSREKPRTDYVFAVTFKEEDKMIGEVILEETDLDQNKSELAFWLSESHWRKGVISEAVEAVMDFAFNNLELNRIEISAFASNKASNELAKKLGFKYEGTKREVSVPESTKKVHNDNIYSMLRREYKKLKK